MLLTGGLFQRFRRISMHFRNSLDSLNGLGIPGNIWFRRFAATYIYRNNCHICNTQYNGSIQHAIEQEFILPQYFICWALQFSTAQLNKYSILDQVSFIYISFSVMFPVIGLSILIDIGTDILEKIKIGFGLLK